MSGKLIVCGNQIGNINHLSEYAIETIRQTKYIVCDTPERFINEVLNLLKINPNTKTMIGFNSLNTDPVMNFVFENISQHNVLFITDNGMPCVADWGSELINAIHNKNIPIEIIPGPSIVTTALAAAGVMPGNQSSFMFFSLMDYENSEIIKYLKIIKNTKSTAVLLDYPNSMQNILALAQNILDNKFAALCINLTLKDQKIIRGNIDYLIKEYSKIEGNNFWVTLVV